MAQQLKKIKSTCQGRRHGFDPWVGKIHWRRKGQPIPVFLPGKPHGQRSLVGYSPLGHKRVGHLTPCSVSLVWLFATPWTAAHQASLSHFPKFSQIHVHWVSYPTISSSITPFSSFPQFFPAWGFFQWVYSSHQVTKALELQLQHQSFQWIFRVDFF